MNDPNTAVNLKGFAVGDPCIGTKDQDPAYGVAFQLDFLWGHGQLSKRTAAEVEHACAVDTSPRATAARIAAGEMPANGECTAALKQMKEEVRACPSSVSIRDAHECCLLGRCTYDPPPTTPLPVYRHSTCSSSNWPSMHPRNPR